MPIEQKAISKNLVSQNRPKEPMVVPTHKMAIYIDVVKDFSADSTGSKDASKEIQAALDSAHQNGGGVVFFPAGTYMIGVSNQPKAVYPNIPSYYIQNKPLIIYSNTRIIGAGMGRTMLKLADNVNQVANPQNSISASASIFLNYGNSWWQNEQNAGTNIPGRDTNIIIEQLTVDGNRDKQFWGENQTKKLDSQGNPLLDNAGNYVLDTDVNVWNMKYRITESSSSNGFFFDNASGITVRDVEINNFMLDGLCISHGDYGVSDCVFENINVNGCKRFALAITGPAHNVNYLNCICVSNFTDRDNYAFNGSVDIEPDKVVEITDISFFNCHFVNGKQGFALAGFEFQPSMPPGGTQFKNISLYNCKFDHTLWGIRIGRDSGGGKNIIEKFLVVKCTFENLGNTAFIRKAGVNGTGEISNCSFIRNGLFNSALTYSPAKLPEECCLNCDPDNGTVVFELADAPYFKNKPLPYLETNLNWKIIDNTFMQNDSTRVALIDLRGNFDINKKVFIMDNPINVNVKNPNVQLIDLKFDFTNNPGIKLIS